MVIICRCYLDLDIVLDGLAMTRGFYFKWEQVNYTWNFHRNLKIHGFEYSRIFWIWQTRVTQVKREKLDLNRISTKWPYFLRIFCTWSAINFARFCSIFLRNLHKTGSIAQHVNFYAKHVIANWPTFLAQNQKFA